MSSRMSVAGVRYLSMTDVAAATTLNHHAGGLLAPADHCRAKPVQDLLQMLVNPLPRGSVGGVRRVFFRHRSHFRCIEDRIRLPLAQFCCSTISCVLVLTQPTASSDAQPLAHSVPVERGT